MCNRQCVASLMEVIYINYTRNITNNFFNCRIVPILKGDCINIVGTQTFDHLVIDAMPMSRKCQQKTVRKGHVKLIVDHMARQLSTKKQMERIHSTNRVLPLGSMRCRGIKRIFGGWVLQFLHSGRILTYRLAKEVYRDLRKRLDMVGPNDPDEITRLHNLLKTARKRQIPKPARVSKPAKTKMSDMDQLETVPMFMEENWEEWFVSCTDLNLCVFVVVLA